MSDRWIGTAPYESVMVIFAPGVGARVNVEPNRVYTLGELADTAAATIVAEQVKKIAKAN